MKIFALLILSLAVGLLTGCQTTPSTSGGGGTAALAHPARARETVKLSSGKLVNFEAQPGWHFVAISVPAAQSGFEKAFKFRSDADENIELFVYLRTPSNRSFATSAGFRAHHEIDCSRFCAYSLEQRVIVDVLPMASGRAIFSSFTDKGLLGLPTSPGHFRVLTIGTIYLTGGVVSHCELLANSTSTKEFKNALQVVRSLRVTTR